ncbi:MAG: crotonyl-CoA carboxylase/reductase [Polyangiales bacterium]
MPQARVHGIHELPPLGVVPTHMHAYAIREERFGEPMKSFEREVLPTWDPGPGEVLVQVMAAGVNFNGVWAGLGEPVSVLKGNPLGYHIAGSDASGVVWKVGEGVTRWKVGDEVVLHCNHTCGECEHCNGGEPLACRKQQIWGYETPDGSFAQYTRVQSQQLLPKPNHLTWEEAASYGLTFFTAYRMLIDRAGLRAGEDVLIWGAGGGLGVFAVQLAKLVGARAVAVVSTEEKAELAMQLGAHGVINRKEFPDLAQRENETDEQAGLRMLATKAFGKRIWQILGEKKGPEVVFEHVGRSTFASSVFLANRFGRIVICGATTGFQLNFDVRHLWMHQKSIIGSHFADAGEATKANQLIERGQIRPVLTRTFKWEEIPAAHQEMFENKLHGNVACLVGAPREGLKNLEETRAALASHA